SFVASSWTSGRAESDARLFSCPILPPRIRYVDASKSGASEPWRHRETPEAGARPSRDGDRDDRAGPRVSGSRAAAPRRREGDHQREKDADPRSHRSLSGAFSHDAQSESKAFDARVQRDHEVPLKAAGP